MYQKLKILFYFFCFIFFSQNSLAQNIGIIAKYCDTTKLINDILSTDKGSIYAAGNDYAAGDNQATIIKLDKDYNIIWKKPMGGSQSDRFIKIRQISENRLLLIGMTLSTDGDLSPYGYTQPTIGNIWVLITDTAGNKIYGNVYGYGGSTIVTDVTLSNKGNIYILGKTLANLGDFAGNAAGPFSYNAFVIRTDTMLTKKWLKIFEGSDDESASGIAVNNKEQILISFGTPSYDGDFTLHAAADGQSVAIIKCIDTAQNLIWEKKYGGSSGEQGFALIYDNTTDDIFFIGSGWSKDGDMWDASPNLNKPEISSTMLTWAMRLDSLGNKKWSRVYGPLGDNPSYFASCHIQENQGGGILKNGQLYVYSSVAGRDDSEIGESLGGGDKTDLWLMVLDTANGNRTSKLRLGGQCPDIPTFIKASAYNGDIYLGARTGTGCPVDTPLNTFGCHLGTVAVNSFLVMTLGYWPNIIFEHLKEDNYLKIYPNPAKDIVIIERERSDKAKIEIPYKIVVYSKDGRMTYESRLLPKQNKVKISTSQWSTGIYFIRYEGNGVKGIEQVIID